MALSTFTGAARQLLARELIEHAGKPHRANGMGDYAEATVALRITAAGLAAIGMITEPASATQAYRPYRSPGASISSRAYEPVS